MYILNLVKKLFGILSAVLAYLFLAPFAFAQTPTPVIQQLIGCPLPPFDIVCFRVDSVPGIISAAITFFFVIAVIIAIFFLLFGAVKWISSGGDKAAMEGARGMITASIVGLVVIFFVFLIYTVVLRFFGLTIENITNIPKIPPPGCTVKGDACPTLRGVEVEALCCNKSCGGVAPAPRLCN